MTSAGKIILMGFVTLLILLVTAAGLGWVLHNEIMVTYAHNYQILIDQGVELPITSPQVVSERVLVILLWFPMIGLGLALPCLLLALRELYKINSH